MLKKGESSPQRLERSESIAHKNLMRTRTVHVTLCHQGRSGVSCLLKAVILTATGVSSDLGMGDTNPMGNFGNKKPRSQDWRLKQGFLLEMILWCVLRSTISRTAGSLRQGGLEIP